MVYHLIVGDIAAAGLQAAFPEETVIPLRDLLNVAPIQRAEGQSFSALRTAFWQAVTGAEKPIEPVADLERVLTATTALNNDDEARIWIWLGQIPADLCAYYWLLPLLKKHAGRVDVLSLAGLPFLNEEKQVFFPKSFAEVGPAELHKARRLARPVTGGEWETDGDVWPRLTEENAGLRIHHGIRDVQSADEDAHDALLLEHCADSPQKSARVVAGAMKAGAGGVGDVFLRWRLRKMAVAGRIHLRESTKPGRDFEVMLPGGDTTIQPDQDSTASSGAMESQHSGA